LGGKRRKYVAKEREEDQKELGGKPLQMVYNIWSYKGYGYG